MPGAANKSSATSAGKPDTVWRQAALNQTAHLGQTADIRISGLHNLAVCSIQLTESGRRVLSDVCFQHRPSFLPTKG